MSESIVFPSASLEPKLSACPSTKIPQTADWILQDFFSTKLAGNDTPLIQLSELVQCDSKVIRQPYLKTFSDDLIASWFEYSNVVALDTEDNDDYLCHIPDLDSARSSDFGDDAEEEFARYLEMFPVIVEPPVSPCVASVKPQNNKSIQPDENDQAPQNDIDHRNAGRPHRSLLTKRKSTSSFSSLRSIMHVFQGNKKSKFEHPLAEPSDLEEKQARKNKHFSSKLLHYFKRHT